MQCVNCQFHNMPGSGVCGRCGTSLRLGSAMDIDVHPPRAGAAALVLRRVVPYRQWWHFLRNEAIRNPLAAFARALGRPPEGLPDSVSSDGLMWRAIVPGWPQWYARQRWQGATFFIAYVVLMTMGILDVLRGGAGLVLGLAFAVHACGCIDIVYQSWHGDGLLVRFTRAMGTSMLLMFAVYGPPMWALGRYAAPTRVGYTASASLVAGDVVLVSSAAPGSVGDVVIYHASFREAPGEGGRGIGFNGQLIDRVLAGPGDRVVCRGGAMTVNGRITAAHWLNSTYRPANLDLVVPDGSLFILPSNLPDRVSRLRQRGDGLGEISLVPQQRVSGVVWARVSPWSRRGRI